MLRRKCDEQEELPARGGSGAGLPNGVGRGVCWVAHRPREQVPVVQRKVTDRFRISRFE